MVDPDVNDRIYNAAHASSPSISPDVSHRGPYDLVVLGAGVVGVTTAYWAQCAGLSVAVVDRHPHAALQTSFANGGQIAVSYAEPWANPRMPAKLLRWLFESDSPLVFRPSLDPHQWRWIASFLWQCRRGASERNLVEIARLAVHSREQLRRIREVERIDYAHRQQGIIRFYRSDKEIKAVRRAADLINEHGGDCRIIGVDRLTALEPAFQSQSHKLAGAVYTPDDESGDTRRFTQQLADICRQRGAAFFYDTSVTNLLTKHGQSVRAVEVRSADGYSEIEGRHFAVCLGAESALFLRPHGIRLNLYPVKGYSVSIPTGDGGSPPTTALIDDRNKLVYSHLGDHLRVAGTGELSGYRRHLDQRRCRAMVERVRELFPDAGDFQQARFWADLRPATPSNVPYIGGTDYRNLWLNTGHGTLGWTLSAGSGERLVSLITGDRSG